MVYWKLILEHIHIKDQQQKYLMKIQRKRKIQNMKFVWRKINLIRNILLIQVGPDGMYIHNTQYGNEDDDEDMEDDDDGGDDNDEENDEDNDDDDDQANYYNPFNA